MRNADLISRLCARAARKGAVLAVGAAVVAPGSALAQTSAGGAYAAEPPVVSGVSCRLACAGLDRAAPGSTVRLSGEAMDGATQVVFLGGGGPADDVRAPAGEVTPTSVDAVVPEGATTGRVRVAGAEGQLSKASTRSLVVGAVQTADAPVVEARVDSKRVFLDGRRKPSLSFFVGGAQPAAVRVDLLRDGDPAPVASWTPAQVPAGTVQTIEWEGPAASGRRKVAAPASGRYVFRVSAHGDGYARSAQADGATATSAFVLLEDMFPVRAKHDFGGAVAHFGGGRGHEGQDVFARCGSPIVAAHGGVVKHKALQSRAGNYLVIQTPDGVDHAYMHLQAPAIVDKGDAVATGQLVGRVGDTGRAFGCHLHFEKWTAPGWYTGGGPVDPLPDLMAWDRVS